jgi:hypothetical protein
VDGKERKSASYLIGPTWRAGLAWLSGAPAVEIDPPRPARASDWWLLEDITLRALKALGYFAQNAEHLLRWAS